MRTSHCRMSAGWTHQAANPYMISTRPQRTTRNHRALQLMKAWPSRGSQRPLRKWDIIRLFILIQLCFWPTIKINTLLRREYLRNRASKEALRMWRRSISMDKILVLKVNLQGIWPSLKSCYLARMQCWCWRIKTSWNKIWCQPCKAARTDRFPSRSSKSDWKDVKKDIDILEIRITMLIKM